jgi:hypothetical protein
MVVHVLSVYCNILRIYRYILDLYQVVYLHIPIFASHCLNSDLSNSDSSISCYVYGMCIHADSSIRNFPKGMKKRLKI